MKKKNKQQSSLSSSEELLELAVQYGAQEAEVYRVQSESYSVSFQSNRLKQIESAQSQGTALRLWHNGSPGVAVAYGEFEPKLLVEKALNLSRLNPAEEIEITQGRIEDLSLSAKAEFDNQTFLEEGKKSIEAILHYYPDVICSANLDWGEEKTRLVNSRGLDCQYSDYSFSLMLGAEWVRSDDFLGIYDGESAHHLPKAQPIVDKILKSLAWSKRNVCAPNGKIPILFSSNAATMLWGTVVSALNAKYVLEDSSPWSDSLLEEVVSPKLRLWQDPTLEQAWCPFDDEGLPTKTVEFISQGVLQNFYSDLKRAKQLKITSSGNGFRSSLGSYPSPDLVNLIVEGGSSNLEQLISGLDCAILVEQVLGQEPDISGDFSLNIDLGYYIEQGQIKGRIKDTMIAGNVYTALKEVIALGNDNRWIGSCYTPSLIVDSLSVIG